MFFIEDVGSSPIKNKLDHSQMVRHSFLIRTFGGSNPPDLSIYTFFLKQIIFKTNMKQYFNSFLTFGGNTNKIILDKDFLVHKENLGPVLEERFWGPKK